MAYGELITLGESFDGDNTLDTSFVKSDAVDANGKVVEVQVRLIGESGDTDDVEVYQFNSLAGSGGFFDTEGKSLGTITLDEDNEVAKSFNTVTSRTFKIGLKMESGSTETPSYRGSYTINDDVDNTNFD